MPLFFLLRMVCVFIWLYVYKRHKCLNVEKLQVFEHSPQFWELQFTSPFENWPLCFSGYMVGFANYKQYVLIILLEFLSIGVSLICRISDTSSKNIKCKLIYLLCFFRSCKSEFFHIFWNQFPLFSFLQCWLVFCHYIVSIFLYLV